MPQAENKHHSANRPSSLGTDETNKTDLGDEQPMVIFGSQESNNDLQTVHFQYQNREYE